MIASLILACNQRPQGMPREDDNQAVAGACDWTKNNVPGAGLGKNKQRHGEDMLLPFLLDRLYRPGSFGLLNALSPALELRKKKLGMCEQFFSLHQSPSSQRAVGANLKWELQPPTSRSVHLLPAAIGLTTSPQGKHQRAANFEFDNSQHALISS
jgi:hypothetical protein